MRTVLLALLALSMSAGPSFAITGELSFRGCPGSADAARAIDLDCASGGTIAIQAVFSAGADIADCYRLVTLIDFTMPGDTPFNHPFWDFNAGYTLYDVSKAADPTEGCTRFLRPFAGDRTSFDYAVAVRGYPDNNTMRLRTSCEAWDPFAVHSNDRIFGFQVILDLGRSVEAGGPDSGCSLPVNVDLVSAHLESQSGGSDDRYDQVCTPGVGCTPALDRVTINGSSVPANRTSWGRLKALYR